ncbi:DUF4335 domain-containing protein [Romeria aff. gracilis LEGE 07310]|uniref:DUF4335 domain-containing protein n=1 Tax=Vasconcelosia minhoensis LEGE 07310 TaxID=915328 RepID=A0A8J7AYB6_9CYAN|nr:DUF4335 domain-containing protein [Romeria gracilis]MBE9078477.1 DUF4335 domain-containing protein [Romeria aff. gracilis LEGE 07310]
MAIAPQRFSTETCILEVIGQNSVLSRWTAQPVVQRLRFRLWLSTEATAPLLLAEGGLSQLEELSQTVQQTIQTRLVLPRLRVTDSGSFRLNLGHPPGAAPQPIIGGQLRSLSHLHLCDIASVLDQYEQQLAALPPRTRTAVSARAPRPLALWMGSAASLLLAVGVAAAFWPRQSALIANQEAAEESAPAESAEALPTAPPFTLGAEPETDTAASERAAAPAPRPTPQPTKPELKTRVIPSPTRPPNAPVGPTAAESEAAAGDIASSNLADNLAEAEPDSSGSARLQLLETTREVQQYFQAQWQANQTDQPLIYQLQLNPDGSIAAFGAVSGEAAAYRDRIALPNPENPAFSPLPQAQPLTLRVELQPDGRVQVAAE